MLAYCFLSLAYTRLNSINDFYEGTTHRKLSIIISHIIFVMVNFTIRLFKSHKKRYYLHYVFYLPNVPSGPKR